MKIEISYLNAKPVVFALNPTPVEDIVCLWASDIPQSMEIATREARNIQTLLGEDLLNLVHVPITPGEGIAEMKLFDDFFRAETANGNLIQVEMKSDALNIIALRKLYNMFNTDAIDYNYVCGLRMHLGFDPNLSDTAILRPIYEPLLLKREDDDTYSIAENEEPVLFLYHNGAFEQVSTGLLNDYTASYRNRIRVLIPETEEFRPFWPGYDTESLIFPFQTLFTLEQENYNYENGGYPSTLYLCNAGRNITPCSSEHKDVKHCLIILPWHPSFSQDPVSSMQGMYANRSRLCPPDCRRFKLDVILRRLKVLRTEPAIG